MIYYEKVVLIPDLVSSPPEPRLSPHLYMLKTLDLQWQNFCIFIMLFYMYIYLQEEVTISKK